MNENKMKLLRIFISTTDKVNNKPLYEKLVFLAKDDGMAGASVFRGVMGFGASTVVHSVKLWEYSEKLPVVVEIIDTEQKIDDFFALIRPILESMEKGCMVSMQELDVLIYKPGHKK